MTEEHDPRCYLSNGGKICNCRRGQFNDRPPVSDAVAIGALEKLKPCPFCGGSDIACVPAEEEPDYESAIIKATYSDYRRVKGRKVLQLIFEVPIEQAPQIHERFGEPAPDGSTWVAIARLNEGAAKVEKPKRSWSELSRAEQAGIACQDADFRHYLAKTSYGNLKTMDAAVAAEAVRTRCDVKSRADLDTDHHGATRWDKLYGDYQRWKMGAAA
jgi:hypothetical protein